VIHIAWGEHGHQGGHAGRACEGGCTSGRSRATKALVPFIAALSWVFLLGTPAEAQVDCAKWEVFVYDDHSWPSHETRNVHKVRTHTFDPTCPDFLINNVRFWSTAHVQNADFTRWVEVGWIERNSSTRYDTFAEWGVVGGNKYHFNGPDIWCCPWSVSKVHYLASDAKWHFQFDLANDGTFSNVYTPTAIGWTAGWAYSETGKCCNTLNPYDHFVDLMRTTNGQGSLVSWNDNVWDMSYGGIPGWTWNWLAEDEWELPQD
jgi:hypothetical protein